MEACGMNKLFILFSLVITIGLFNSCGSSSSSSSGSADQPSTIIATVKSQVGYVGAGIVTSSIVRNGFAAAVPPFVSTNCDTHGDPKSPYNTTSSTSYAGLLTYCKMSVNDGSPDTVAGAFETPRGVSCAVERAGITWDGQPHTLTVTLDTNCFTAAQISDMGVSSVSAIVTGSQPASFNSYFSHGVRIQITGMNIDYQLGTKVNGNSVEFVSTEGAGTTRAGVFAGKFDSSTGKLWYEGRMDRIDCTTSGSCGWNRHIRVYADLSTDGNHRLEDLSFGYSNIQGPPGQSGYAGAVVTATGNLTAGIKARGWNATNGSGGAPTAVAQYDTVGNWSELANTFCYTSTSDAGTGCGTGIALFSTNTKFLLRTGETSPTDFSTTYAGMSYTAVDLNTDMPN